MAKKMIWVEAYDYAEKRRNELCPEGEAQSGGEAGRIYHRRCCARSAFMAAELCLKAQQKAMRIT